MIDIEKEIDQYFKIINDAKINFDLYKGILSNAKENEKRFSKISSFLYPILNALTWPNNENNYLEKFHLFEGYNNIIFLPLNQIK